MRSNLGLSHADWVPSELVNGFVERRSDYTLHHRHQTLPFTDGMEAFFGAVLRRAV